MFATSSQLFTLGLALLPCAAMADQTPPIFNGKNLEGWYVFTKEEGKNKDTSGEVTVAEGQIHIAGKKLGYLSTEKEYADYQLTFSYRWAETQKTDVTRNSGLIYHAIGEDRMWCNSMEFQMQQGDAGDLWLIPGTAANASIIVDQKPYGGVSKGTRVFKSEGNEKPLGEWNHMKLICKGNAFEHWVNGKKVLSGVTVDRTRGKIQFQAEGHEVWIRDVLLEPLADKKP